MTSKMTHIAIPQGMTQQNMTENFVTINAIKTRYIIKSVPPKARRGRILVLPGFREVIEKYHHVLKHFNSLGLEVLCLDWPGQGLSARLAEHNPHLVHCNDFRLYTQTANELITRTGFTEGDSPLFIYGHSMGGHVALHLAHHHLQSKADVPLKAVMLSAPMMMLIVKRPRLTLWLLTLICLAGFGKRPVPKHQVALESQFDPHNASTRDPSGYALQEQIFRKNPRLITLGPSFGWVRAALSSCFKTTLNPKWLKQISVPIDAYLAGDERVVDPTASIQSLTLIPNAEIHLYQDARHELMFELPETTNAIKRRITTFINQHIP